MERSLSFSREDASMEEEGAVLSENEGDEWDAVEHLLHSALELSPTASPPQQPSSSSSSSSPQQPPPQRLAMLAMQRTGPAKPPRTPSPRAAESLGMGHAAAAKAAKASGSGEEVAEETPSMESFDSPSPLVPPAASAYRGDIAATPGEPLASSEIDQQGPVGEAGRVGNDDAGEEEGAELKEQEEEDQEEEQQQQQQKSTDSRSDDTDSVKESSESPSALELSISDSEGGGEEEEENRKGIVEAREGSMGEEQAVAVEDAPRGEGEAKSAAAASSEGSNHGSEEEGEGASAVRNMATSSSNHGNEDILERSPSPTPSPATDRTDSPEADNASAEGGHDEGGRGKEGMADSGLSVEPEAQQAEEYQEEGGGGSQENAGFSSNEVFGDWEICEAPGRECVFYYNVVTEESVWDHPITGESSSVLCCCGGCCVPYLVDAGKRYPTVAAAMAAAIEAMKSASRPSEATAATAATASATGEQGGGDEGRRNEGPVSSTVEAKEEGSSSGKGKGRHCVDPDEVHLMPVLYVSLGYRRGRDLGSCASGCGCWGCACGHCIAVGARFGR